MTTILAITDSREFAKLIYEVCQEKGWGFQVAFKREEMLAFRGKPIDILAVGWHSDRSILMSLALEATEKGCFPASIAVLFDIHDYNLGKPAAITIGAVEYCRLPRSCHDWDASVRREVGDSLDAVLAEADHYSKLQLHGVFKPNQEPDHPLFKNMVESSAICMFATDPDGHIITMNLSGLTLFGYLPAEVAGVPYRTLISPDVAEAAILDMHEVVMHTEGWEGEFLYRKKNAEVFPGWTAVSRIWAPGAILQGLVFTIRDISREKDLERENRGMQLQILQSHKMKSVGVLAGGIAHDFNNLLVGILGYSSKIRCAMDPANPFYDGILQIEKCAERAAQLTESLLAFSRNAPKNPRPLNLNDTINETVKILRSSFPATVEIETRLADGLWTIEADGSQMQQVLMNLCINARDAMPDGGKLVIETANRQVDSAARSRHPGARSGNHVTLSVSDTGVGIPPEQHESIFDPFFSTKPIGEGIGLGLPVAYGIVSSHEGFLEVVSTPGLGSTFTVYLPASDGVAEPDVEKPLTAAGGNEHILLVDDEATIRRLGTEILSAAGYHVHTASDGVEALTVYQQRQEEIDLVLLDLTMPRMGGKACLEELRHVNPDLPIVISSGYSMDSDEAVNEIEGATDFLQKPYRAHELVSTIRSVLDSCSKQSVTDLPVSA